MGFLDGIIGGAVGAEVATVVGSLIAQHGGVQGIVTQLEQQGLGGTVKSWVGTGPNQPISADQVHKAFDPQVLQGLAAKLGINTQDLEAKLAHALPQVVDHLTPGGVVPAQNG